jgi:hypothetical protein
MISCANYCSWSEQSSLTRTELELWAFKSNNSACLVLLRYFPSQTL